MQNLTPQQATYFKNKQKTHKSGAKFENFTPKWHTPLSLSPACARCEFTQQLNPTVVSTKACVGFCRCFSLPTFLGSRPAVTHINFFCFTRKPIKLLGMLLVEIKHFFCEIISILLAREYLQKESRASISKVCAAGQTFEQWWRSAGHYRAENFG